jgi:hypothetical protein
LHTNIRNVVFAFAAGLIAGLAIHDVAVRDPRPDAARITGDGDPEASSAPASTRRDAASGASIREAPKAMSNAAAAAASTGAATATGPANAQKPPLPQAELADDIKARPAPLNGLLNASSLRCDIDVAHGANWSQGKASLHAINYGGGPFSLDSIDLEAETAMMSGGSGVTGSLTGELEMRTTAGSKGLTFAAFTRHDDLLMVTVYPALDSTGRYRAVMTMFGDQFEHETAQFYGGCNISLTQR